MSTIKYPRNLSVDVTDEMLERVDLLRRSQPGGIIPKRTEMLRHFLDQVLPKLPADQKRKQLVAAE